MQVDLYLESDSKSPKTTDGWYGYVLAYTGQQLHTAEGFRFAHGSNHQLYLLAIADALERLNRPCNVTIHLSDKYIARAVQQYLAIWKENDWKNAKGKTLNYAMLWECVENLLQKHKILWITEEKNEFSDWLLTEIERRGKHV